MLTIVILPVSYVVSDPVRNINWVHGFGSLTVPWSAGAVHVLMIMLSVLFAIYLPTHVTLKYYFGGQRPGSS